MASQPFSLDGMVDDRSRYHTFWRRFGAGMFDGLVFVPLAIADYYVSRPGRPEAVLISWAVFTTFAAGAYSILLHARYGQTLGKMVAHVKVWDISEQRLPSFKQAFLRDIGDIVPNCFALVYFVYLVHTGKYIHGNEAANGIPAAIISYANLGWFFLELLTMLFSQKRRAFHDVIAGTVVVVD
jgi:uncharacterized RDD family membrane protein YckC